MSTEHDLAGWTLRVPETSNSAWLPLARAGTITAAELRGLRIETPDGKPLDQSRQFVQGRLPGANWAVLDELADGNRLRIISDLTDPRRASRRRAEDPYEFPWLTKLGLRSPAIDRRDYPRFLADCDMVLTELIDNVHRWSQAGNAYAVVATTRGSASGGSWNRLHLVVADDGIGIPAALRADVGALDAVRAASGDETLRSPTDAQLVEQLMRHAFGDRQLPNHNGHGLHSAQVRAGRWVGALDIVTIDANGVPFRRCSHGVNPADFEGDDRLDLPGARGTLVHLLLQATSEASRRPASEYELMAEPEIDTQLALTSN